MVPSSNAITKPAPLTVQQEITSGVSVFPGKMKVNGVTYPLLTVPSGSITNAPTGGNASMTTRGSCISVRMNTAAVEEGMKPPHQTCVPFLIECMHTSTGLKASHASLKMCRATVIS